ncbi:hypothetical protein G3R49_12405 [Shewanella sp. WXL01]|uniref:hypothetical protein n=1 Tax=Shewanella sp. WXL01 TaxID=2709721 RepID=UPI0014384488|nr:hypothetical protein [Shewanella sp. WXL01]NKF51359.1 hypothetical protein [Shewanella sp. WXL01]
MINFASFELQQYLRRADISAILIAEFDFESGFLRVHSGVGDALYNGNVYKGVGVLGKVGAVKQGNKVNPDRLRFTLSGIPKSLLSTALGEKYQNRPGALYLAALDAYSNIVAADVLFKGRMDVMNTQIGETATIQLDINSRGVDWKNPRNRRFTDADQKAAHPGDRFLESVSQMAEKEINWGVPASTPSGGGGGGNSGRRQYQN